MRFNTPVATRHKTVNLAGGEAFTLDPKTELATLLLTSFVEDQFYRSAETQMEKVRALIAATSDMPKFAAKAAVYARNEFGMRSVSHVTAGEIAARVSGEQWTRPFFASVVRRPDDVTEILAYYLARYGKPIPNALRVGLGRALSRFDAYQLGKYKAAGAAVSLVDAVNLCRPKHTEALGALMTGTLESPDTWEVRLTEAGTAEDVDAAKRDAWKGLIETRKLGYFALLRNLRNITMQAPDALPAALEMLVDETLIRRSLVLPFRFATALEQIEQMPGAATVVAALNRATDVACANVPRLDGRTVVVVDDSGSMQGAGPKAPAAIASLFAAVLVKANPDADLILFSDQARYLTVNPADSVLSIRRQILQSMRPAGTNFHAPIELARRAGKAYDRFVVLSDMQGWIGYNAPTGTLANYERETGARPHVYSFDLQGYGSSMFPQDRLYCLAGFSEKVFDVMRLLEQDRSAMVKKIASVDL